MYHHCLRPQPHLRPVQRLHLAAHIRETVDEPEVEGLLRCGCTGEEKPFESLGYKQALALLRGQMTREQAIESTLIETRQYAKRQRTWFRHQAALDWLPLRETDTPEAVARTIATRYRALSELPK